jgi:hypothetical protein
MNNIISFDKVNHLLLESIFVMIFELSFEVFSLAIGLGYFVFKIELMAEIVSV